MKNIKQFFTYVVVGTLITALFISCKNDDKTGSGNCGNDEDGKKNGTRTLSYYAGNWFGIFSEESGETNIFTINADGLVIMRLGGNETVPSTSITKNSDTSYTYYNTTGTENASIHFNFTSDTEGTLTLAPEGSPDTLNVAVTKK